MNSIPCPLCKGRVYRDQPDRCKECEGLGYIAFNTGEPPRIAPPIDRNVASVRTKLLQRSEVGQRKYGCTTDKAGLTRLQWLRHAQEEALDLSVYLEELIQEEEWRENEAKADAQISALFLPQAGKPSSKTPPKDS